MKHFKIAQINVKRLIQTKADILGKISSDTDVLLLQDIQVPNEETSHLKINGSDLVHPFGHNKNGLAT